MPDYSIHETDVLAYNFVSIKMSYLHYPSKLEHKLSIYEHCLRAINVIPKKITAVPFTELSLAMEAANLGLMCSPKWQLKRFKLQEDLRLKRIGPNGVKRNHYLLVKKSALSKKYINNFISTFEEEFVEKKKNRIVQ